jgi:hypothetical protein
VPTPTTCTRCYVTLPTAATNTVCDDCDGAPEAQPNTRATAPTGVVVHSAALAKSQYLRDFGIPNPVPPANKTKSSA